MLFRCLTCPISYCFDCWPAEIEVVQIAPSNKFIKYFDKRGFPFSKNLIWVQCIECREERPYVPPKNDDDDDDENLKKGTPYTYCDECSVKKKHVSSISEKESELLFPFFSNVKSNDKKVCKACYEVCKKRYELSLVICKICKTENAETDDQLLLCDKCDQGYHTFCIDPPLTSIPTDDKWFCSPCMKKKRKSSKETALIEPRQQAQGVVYIEPRQQAQGVAYIEPRQQAQGVVYTEPRQQAQGVAYTEPRQQAQGVVYIEPRQQAQGVAYTAPRQQAQGVVYIVPRQQTDGTN